MGNNRKIALTGLLLLIGLTLTYLNHFDNDFHFDDSHTIVENAFIRDIGNIPLIFKDAKTTSSLPTNQAYRPVITTLNTIDYWIAGGLDPFYFHLHIFLEYLIICVLLYFIFLKIFKVTTGENHQWVALFGAAFFGFHTANAETINYIIARSDEFSTLMVLLGFLIYINSSGWKKQWGLLPFIIGCFAKPTTLMLPPILFVYDLLMEKPSLLVRREKAPFWNKLRPAILHTLPYFVIGAGLYFFTRSMFSDTWQPSNIKAIHYLNTQPYIFWIYLKTFILPVHLTADTDLKLIKEFGDPRVILGVFVLLVYLVIAVITAMKRKTLPISFGMIWFVVALAPSSSVIPLAEVMNHHRTFFPYIGLVISLSWAVYLLYDYLLEKSKSQMLLRRVFVAFIFIILGAHAYGTYQRNIVWHSDASLWKDVTIKSPENGRGLMNYGLTEMRHGNYQEAIKYYKKARNTTYGNHPYLFINFAIAYDAMGEKAKAEKHFRLALQKGPGYPDCHYFYGKWLLEQGRNTEAITRLNRAMELSPAHGQAKQLLQSADLSSKHLLKEAIKKVDANPTPENYLNLSLQYYNTGQYQKCIEACERALQLKPDYAEAYNNICSAYNKLKQWQKAVEACNNALEIKPNYKLAKGNLNWAKANLEKSGQ